MVEVPTIIYDGPRAANSAWRPPSRLYDNAHKHLCNFYSSFHKYPHLGMTLWAWETKAQ